MTDFILSCAIVWFALPIVLLVFFGIAECIGSLKKGGKL